MSKFKVGDKVRIKADLIMGERYEGLPLTPTMESFRGRIAEILEVENIYLKLDIDLFKFWWTGSMLDKLPTQDRPKGTKNKAKKVIEVSKCPKTVTGKHIFIYQTHSVFSSTNGIGGAGLYIDDFLSCKYCGIVDDREVKL